MALDLLKRSEKGSPLTAADHDTNFTNIETEVNGKVELPVSDATSIVSDPVDSTKQMRLDVGAVSTSTVRVITVPDQNVDLTPASGTFASAAQGALADSATQPGDAVTTFDGTAHRLLYIDLNGDVVELAFGTSGQVLKSNGASSAPSFEDIGAAPDPVQTANIADFAVAPNKLEISDDLINVADALDVTLSGTDDLIITIRGKTGAFDVNMPAVSVGWGRIILNDTDFTATIKSELDATITTLGTRKRGVLFRWGAGDTEWALRDISRLETGLGTAAAEDVGIADNQILQVDASAGAPADNEFARFTASGIEGRTTDETKTHLAIVLADVGDSGTAAAENVGTAVGNVVQLENVGGSPGLPAVDGSQLTGVTASDNFAHTEDGADYSTTAFVVGTDGALKNESRRFTNTTGTQEIDFAADLAADSYGAFNLGSGVTLQITSAAGITVNGSADRGGANPAIGVRGLVYWERLGTDTFLVSGDTDEDRDVSGLTITGAATYSGEQTFSGGVDANGSVVAGTLAGTGTVTGTMTTAGHSGAVLRTTGNVTVPSAAGFNVTLIAGGAHTVTFGGTTSAAMASGDMMSIVVDDQPAIHAILTAAADKVAFS